MEMVGQLIKILFYMSLFHIQGYGKCDISGTCNCTKAVWGQINIANFFFNPL